MVKIRNYLGRNLSSKRTTDKITIKKRSELMSKIKSKRTTFELLFFELLKKEKIKFKAHPKGVLGKPDIFISNKNTLIFLDSDFWHGWQYPRWKHKLKNDWWREKIEKNRRRDRRTTRALKRKGYKVLRLWEHQIKNDSFKCINRIKSLTI